MTLLGDCRAFQTTVCSPPLAPEKKTVSCLDTPVCQAPACWGFPSGPWDKDSCEFSTVQEILREASVKRRAVEDRKPPSRICAEAKGTHVFASAERTVGAHLWVEGPCPRPWLPPSQNARNRLRKRMAGTPKGRHAIHRRFSETEKTLFPKLKVQKRK